MWRKSGYKTAANEFFLFEFFTDVLVVVDCTALHGFVELECYVDFGTFRKLAAVFEQESDMHIERARLVIAVVMDVCDFDSIL
jgi:hypothetical protein